MIRPEHSRHPSSFRDPSGHIFIDSGTVYRQINTSYFDNYDRLIESGLYQSAIDRGLLIPHQTVREETHLKIIKPLQLEFISYPCEWSFGQLQDAACVTLELHGLALDYGMVLKDATGPNVQFHQGKPLLVDTLSFDTYQDGDPWWAYGQFCRHFLAPLLLMKYVSPDINRHLGSHLDGVPLDIASNMLPWRTHLVPSIKANLHVHAKMLSRHKESLGDEGTVSVSKNTQLSIVENMLHFVGSLRSGVRTEWSEYYDFSNYGQEAFENKERIIKKWIDEYNLRRIWDVGGNNGHFSRLIAESCETIICTDIDANAIDQNYRQMRKNDESKLVPLVLDFVNPTPGFGFMNRERISFADRIKNHRLDAVLALALIHHLSITANCTFEMLAELFAALSPWLIIEFVDPNDTWADKMLRSKRHARRLFAFYNRDNFERVFSTRFETIEVLAIPDTQRHMYVMRRKAT